MARRGIAYNNNNNGSNTANNSRSLPLLGRNPSDETLMAYTFVPFQNREQWLQVAKESVVTPRFLLSTNGELLFGSHNAGFSRLNPEYVIASVNRYSSYELMTLREVLPTLYNKVVEKLPTTEYVVNLDNKQVVKTGDMLAIRQAAEKTFAEAGVNYQVVVRPVKYMKRGYTDITDDFINSGVVKLLPSSSSADDEELLLSDNNDSDNEDDSLEQANYEQERQQALSRVQQEIKLRVQTRYPAINNVLTSYFSVAEVRADIRHKFFLYVELDYIFLGASLSFIDGNADVVILNKDGITYVWPSRLLQSISNPTTEAEMAFYEIIADLTDYVSIYRHTTYAVGKPEQQTRPAGGLTGSKAIPTTATRRQAVVGNTSRATTPTSTASLPTRRAVTQTPVAAATTSQRPAFSRRESPVSTRPVTVAGAIVRRDRSVVASQPISSRHSVRPTDTQQAATATPARSRPPPRVSITRTPDTK